MNIRNDIVKLLMENENQIRDEIALALLNTDDLLENESYKTWKYRQADAIWKHIIYIIGGLK
jgi:hypothetical protein